MPANDVGRAPSPARSPQAPVHSNHTRSNSSIAALALVRDTFREAFARKIFWAFFACSTALIVFFIFIMRVDVVEGALATASLFGRSGPTQSVEKMVAGVHAGIANFLYSI